MQDPVSAALGVVQAELLRIRAIADAEHEKNMKLWRHRMAVAEKEFKDRLADPAFVESLDLPYPLPAFTVKILKRTMAGDKVGPSMPKRSDTYRKYGLKDPDSHSGVIVG